MEKIKGNTERLPEELEGLIGLIAKNGRMIGKKVAYLQGLVTAAGEASRQRAELEQISGTDAFSRVRRVFARLRISVLEPSAEDVSRAGKILARPLEDIDLYPRDSFFNPMTHLSEDTVGKAEEEINFAFANVVKALNAYREARGTQWVRIHERTDAVLSEPHTVSQLPQVLEEVMQAVAPVSNRPGIHSLLPAFFLEDTFLIEAFTDLVAMIA